MADEDITVTDTVSYKNLIPNTTYTVKRGSSMIRRLASPCWMITVT